MALKKAGSQPPPKDKERRRVKRDFASLITQLNDPDPQKRRWAVRDLAQYKEDAIDPLCNRLTVEQDAAVQEAILSVLEDINEEPIAEKLIPLLSSQDAGLRNKVIETLQNMPDQMEKYIESLLKDPDPDIRIFAINILESLKHKDVPKWLLNTALNDEHINVVATSLDALTELVSPEMKEDLKKIQQRFKDDPYINFVIDSMLENL